MTNRDMGRAPLATAGPAVPTAIASEHNRFNASNVAELAGVFGDAASGVSTKSRSRKEAHRLLCERYKRHSLELAGNRSAFDFFHATARVDVGSFNILQYGTSVRIDPGDFEDFYMLEMPLSGGVDLQLGSARHHSHPGQALIISPGRRLISFWRPGTVQVMLKIDRGQMLRRWNMLTGRAAKSPPVFRTALPLDTPEGWRIKRLMQLLAEEFAQFAHDPRWRIGESQLPLSIVDTLLLNVDHDQSQHRPGTTPNILPRHVKRCTAFIGENLGQDISVAQLARYCGASERSVYEGFRKFLDTTPKQYLLEMRLAAARQMLLAGDHSVSNVIRQCGFRHAGRFSRYYFERFAEYPSQTASRSA